MSETSEQLARCKPRQLVDLAVFCCGMSVDERMTFAFLDHCGDLPRVLAHPQGMDHVPEDGSLIDHARLRGGHNAVQLYRAKKRTGRC